MTPVKPITKNLRGFIELLEERYPDEISVPGSDQVDLRDYIEGYEL